ncbi:hypothetical protein D3C76_1491520 [compost metagenome]
MAYSLHKRLQRLLQTIGSRQRNSQTGRRFLRLRRLSFRQVAQPLAACRFPRIPAGKRQRPHTADSQRFNRFSLPRRQLQRIFAAA